MAPLPIQAVVPVEASDATAGDASIIKGGGKRLSWTEEENVALARAASIVCNDPCVGAGMTIATMNKKVRAAFINDPSKPPEACTTRDKGAFDSRRWDRRSFLACGKQSEILRRECTKFKGFVDRIRKMNLTGNPDESDVHRCASLLCSDGGQSISHVYDCVRNPNYHISKPFKFDKTYSFLSIKTNTLEAGELHVLEEKKRIHPTGTKTAKKLREEKKSAVAKTEESSSMSASIKRIEQIMVSNAAQRQEFSQKKLSFQKEKMKWEMVETMLGPGSDANHDEREAIGVLLRKRLMASLSRNVDEHPEKRVCLTHSENESNGISALLKMPNVSGSCSEEVISSVSNGLDTDE